MKCTESKREREEEPANRGRRKGAVGLIQELFGLLEADRPPLGQLEADRPLLGPRQADGPLFGPPQADGVLVLKKTVLHC